MPFVHLSQHWVVHATFLTMIFFVILQPKVFLSECGMEEDNCKSIEEGVTAMIIEHCLSIFFEFWMAYL